MSVQEKIYTTLEQIQKIKQVRDHYEDTCNELESAYKELDRLEIILEKELQDVEEIQAMSMKALFHKILGSKEEQVEKERQEYLQAHLKYNEFRKSVEVLEYEKSILEKKLRDDTKLKQELEKMKSLRENEILRSDPVLTTRLSSISTNMDELFVRTQKIETALLTGRKSAQILDSIISELKKARQWGNWDMVSKDKMSSYMKYGSIDRAKNLSFQARQYLHRFEQELLQAGKKQQSFSFNIDHFSKFTDIFFDNLISDWVIQQKIVNAISNVQDVKDKLTRVLTFLEDEIKDINRQLENLQVEKEKILLS